MAVKLTSETLVTIDHDDLCAVLTEHICNGSYGAFSDLEVTIINQDKDSRGFSLVLNPKPKDSE